MKISWIKSVDDKKSFNIIKGMGMDVFEVENPENTDKKIKELVDLEYNTIVISNQLAYFSEDIIKKYSKTQNVNIIITPSKRE